MCGQVCLVRRPNLGARSFQEPQGPRVSSRGKFDCQLLNAGDILVPGRSV